MKPKRKLPVPEKVPEGFKEIYGVVKVYPQKPIKPINPTKPIKNF